MKPAWSSDRVFLRSKIRAIKGLGDHLGVPGVVMGSIGRGCFLYDAKKARDTREVEGVDEFGGCDDLVFLGAAQGMLVV